MECAYKLRIYPTKEQEKQIQENFGSSRFVFNHFLAERKELYEQTGKSPTKYAQMKELTTLKQEYEWLKRADSTALQASVEQLDTVFQNFFHGLKTDEKIGYPRFKSKKEHCKSYKSKCVGTSVKVFSDSIQLPKLGKVKCEVSKFVRGRILTATVSQDSSGKYYVSICCTDVEIEPLPKTCSVVGLDMGLKSFAADSNEVEYPKSVW